MKKLFVIISFILVSVTAIAGNTNRELVEQYRDARNNASNLYGKYKKNVIEARTLGDMADGNAKYYLRKMTEAQEHLDKAGEEKYRELWDMSRKNATKLYLLADKLVVARNQAYKDFIMYQNLYTIARNDMKGRKTLLIEMSSYDQECLLR